MRILSLLSCAWAVLLSQAAAAQPGLQITGLAGPARTLTAAEIAALPHLTQTAPDKAGRSHRYEGVAVAGLLALVGAPNGAALHGDALQQVLVVSGADGYHVVFALPELDPTFAEQTVLLADRCDGQPLPSANGPYQLLVPHEKRPARWVRQVTSLRMGTVNPAALR